ncbi:hypothetical protein ACWEV4_23040 [Streptomyces sp. NPDC003860]
MRSNNPKGYDHSQLAEVSFVAAVRSAGSVAGGLHPKTTPDVTERATPTDGLSTVGEHHTSHCHPRLSRCF